MALSAVFVGTLVLCAAVLDCRVSLTLIICYITDNQKKPAVHEYHFVNKPQILGLTKYLWRKSHEKNYYRTVVITLTWSRDKPSASKLENTLTSASMPGVKTKQCAPCRSTAIFSLAIRKRGLARLSQIHPVPKIRGTQRSWTPGEYNKDSRVVFVIVPWLRFSMNITDTAADT